MFFSWASGTILSNYYKRGYARQILQAVALESLLWGSCFPQPICACDDAYRFGRHLLEMELERWGGGVNIRWGRDGMDQNDR